MYKPMVNNNQYEDTLNYPQSCGTYYNTYTQMITLRNIYKDDPNWHKLTLNA